MANLSLLRRASALLLTKTRSIALERNVATQPPSKGPLVEVSHNEKNGLYLLYELRELLPMELCISAHESAKCFLAY